MGSDLSQSCFKHPRQWDFSSDPGFVHRNVALKGDQPQMTSRWPENSIDSQFHTCDLDWLGCRIVGGSSLSTELALAALAVTSGILGVLALASCRPGTQLSQEPLYIYIM